MSPARAATLAAVLALSGACTPAPRPSSADAAVYEMTFQSTWTKASHPTDYPEGISLDLGAAHFSGMIGAPHSASYSMFKEGVLATDGLMELAHFGNLTLLDSELADAAAAGAAGEPFVTGIFVDVNAPKSVYFEVSARLPLVSFATMLAPSSDWFVGLADVDLKEDGQWVSSRSVPAFTWDSGTHEGDTYKVPFALTTPRQPVALSGAPAFLYGDSRPPVATITFQRIY